MKLRNIISLGFLCYVQSTVVQMDGQGASVELTADTNIWGNRNYKFECIPPEYLGTTHIFQTSHDGLYTQIHMTSSEQVDWYILIRADAGNCHGGIADSTYVSDGKLVLVDGPMWDLDANFHATDPQYSQRTEVYKWTETATSTDLTIVLSARLTGAVMWTLPGAITTVTACKRPPPCGDTTTQYYDENDACVDCPAGYTCDGDTATCDTNKYVDNGECKDCPDGYMCDGSETTTQIVYPKESFVFQNDPDQRAICRERLTINECKVDDACSWNVWQGLCNEFLHQPLSDCQQCRYETTTTTPSPYLKLGDPVEKDGHFWIKVVEIEGDNRNHYDSESTEKKLSDAEINELRSQGTGKMWLECDGTEAFIDQQDTLFDASGATTRLNYCSSNPDGPFTLAQTEWQEHRIIDCYNMGIHLTYSHDGLNGCYNPTLTMVQTPGALYVEQP